MTGLVAGAPVMVRFHGDRARVGPLTLGQLNILQWLDRIDASSEAATIAWSLDIPAGTRIDDVAAAVAVLLARHETLRTHYVRGEPPTQHVRASGELALDVYTCPARDDTDVEGELTRRLRARPMDIAAGPPLRVGLAVASDRVLAGVVLFSHVAVDYRAVEIIGREFTGMLRDPSSRQVGEPRHQPVDQAELEQDPRFRRRTEAALRYWAAHVRRMPQCLGARTRTVDGGGPAVLQLTSPAAAMALRHVAARTRMSRPTVVLAAVCAVLAEFGGHRSLIFPILSGNRFERGLSDFVGTLAQATLFSVDVDTDGFDDLIMRTGKALLRANLNGLYDVYRQAADTDRVARDRGIHFVTEPLFNNVVVDSESDGPLDPIADVSAARRRTTVRRQPAAPTPAVLRFDLWRLDDFVTLRLWTGDTGRIPPETMDSLLTAVDRLLVTAAAGDLDLARMRRAIGLAEITRGEGWLLIDSCWIEMAEVQLLVDKALAPAVARVFPAVEGDELVCYVAADDVLRTPAEVHARCVASLPGRSTAMAPRRYVLCDGVPDDPADPVGWQRRPVVSAGSGRLPIPEHQPG